MGEVVGIVPVQCEYDDERVAVPGAHFQGWGRIEPAGAVIYREVYFSVRGEEVVWQALFCVYIYMVGC